MTDFVRFPRTPHLVVLGSRELRDDKVMPDDDARSFLEKPIIVEEKLDGENLGLSFDGHRVRAQSRGDFVEPGGLSFRGLASWLRPRALRIGDTLGEDLILFGEWCSVRHSVAYDALPDWFIAFDVFDRRTRSFWPLKERDLLTESLRLASPPQLGVGKFGIADLVGMLGTSRFGSEPMEGIVLRHIDRPNDRAKIVRSDFLQAIDTHWRSRPLVPNRLGRPKESVGSAISMPGVTEP